MSKSRNIALTSKVHKQGQEKMKLLFKWALCGQTCNWAKDTQWAQSILQHRINIKFLISIFQCFCHIFLTSNKNHWNFDVKCPNFDVELTSKVCGQFDVKRLPFKCSNVKFQHFYDIENCSWIFRVGGGHSWFGVTDM